MDGRRERVGVIGNSFAASDIGVVGSEDRSSNFSASRWFSSESIFIRRILDLGKQVLVARFYGRWYST